MVIDIAGRKVGPGEPCFIIAEAGVNHGGSLDAALELVGAAAYHGADAVKFQAFSAARLTTDPEERARLAPLELSAGDFGEIARVCGKCGLIFLASAFDRQSVDMLVEVGVPALKAASGELTDLALLRYMASTGLPTLISTGMASMQEIIHAVCEFLRQPASTAYSLLHCVSCYPTQVDLVNLRAMEVLSRTFPFPVGYSDHTVGIEVSLAAVAAGASVLEKHLMLRGLSAPDAAVSVTPDTFGEMVDRIRLVEKAMGSAVKSPALCEEVMRLKARKSLVAACDIKAGETLVADMVVCMRPGTGLPPGSIEQLVGRKACSDVAKHTMLTEGLFE